MLTISLIISSILLLTTLGCGYWIYKNHQQVKSSKELTERLNALEDFIVTLNHEIRTPLNSIIGIADIMQSEKNIPQEHRKLVESLNSTSESLLALINNIIDFAQVEAEHLELKPITADFEQLCCEACKGLWSNAKEHNVLLVVDYPPGVPREIFADVTRLRQIILNLVNNSLKYTREGHVAISVGRGKTPYSLLIKVEDTGVGIDKKNQQIIQAEFNLTNTNSFHRMKNSGLGLTICQYITQIMGGTIGFESNEGVGTTFWVDLPIIKQTEHTVGEPEDEDSVFSTIEIDEEHFRPDENVISGKTILVLTHHRISQRILNSFLMYWGANVTICSSLLNFRQLTQDSKQPAIIISDYYLPDGKVSDIYSTYKASNWTNVPFVILSGTKELQYISAIPQEDACLLQHPINSKELKHLLEDLLSGKQHTITESLHQDIDLIRQKILLVDDDDIERRVTGSMLANHNADVYYASNGKLAVHQSEHTKFDLIIMDLKMPVMDGYDAAELIRDRGENMQTPIIAVTADVLHDTKEKCEQSGINDLLDKPFKPEQMLNLMSKHLEYRTSDASIVNFEKSQSDILDPKRIQLLKRVFKDGFPDLVNEFIDTANNELLSIEQCCTENDKQQVQKQVHSLKSSFANFGINDVYQQLHEIEAEIDEIKLEELTDTIQGMLEKFEKVYVPELMRQVNS